MRVACQHCIAGPRTTALNPTAVLSLLHCSGVSNYLKMAQEIERVRIAETAKGDEKHVVQSSPFRERPLLVRFVGLVALQVV